MTTVFAVYNSQGCVGRCDAKCHNAKEPECHCICGGAFHGVGSRIAMADRGHLTDAEILENVRKIAGGGKLRVVRVQEQMTLFPGVTDAEKKSEKALDLAKPAG